MSLQQNHLISVTVDGRPLGVFDTRTGGEITAAPTKRRSGGMGPIKQHKALPDYGDTTVTRDYELARDHPLYPWLAGRCGKGEMVVADFLLDPNGQRFGRPTTYTGILMTVTSPDADANSTDTNTLGLTMQTRNVA
jgi:hypothetical protein